MCEENCLDFIIYTALQCIALACACTLQNSVYLHLRNFPAAASSNSSCMKSNPKFLYRTGHKWHLTNDARHVYIGPVVHCHAYSAVGCSLGPRCPREEKIKRSDIFRAFFQSTRPDNAGCWPHISKYQHSRQKSLLISLACFYTEPIFFSFSRHDFYINSINFCQTYIRNESSRAAGERNTLPDQK
jgi:hypothetical protein